MGAFISKEKLISPPDKVVPHLQAALQQDDLYGEEFISNHELLRCCEGSGLTPTKTLRERPSLLKILLTDSDWKEIAIASGNSVREQVLSQVNFDNKASV
jgi:hypothetical protein